MTDAPEPSQRQRLTDVIRQPISLAIAVAAGITLLLVILLLTIWSTDANPAAQETSQLAASMLTAEASENAPTPTPRVIATRAPASPPAAVTERADGIATAATPIPTEPAPATRTAPRAAKPTEAAATTASVPVIVPSRSTKAASRPGINPPRDSTPEIEPLYLAEGRSDFIAWAVNSWSINEDQLVNEGNTIVGEPWAIGPYRPDDEDYALEAEVRVRDLAPNVCDQSFGIVAGPDGNGVVWGGGVIFRCPGGEPSGRITDVANVGNGYNQDREIASGAFDPGDTWHTYRLEVRGNRLTLLIDGEEVANGTDTTAARSARASQIGIWSQGVRLSVRRIAVYPLEAATD
ncbi:MAG: DUF1080 domain-containing protein [Chloroflexota bacterium]|nr:DUF1080 domain-containing protein [Chloroflexota bacterium]